MQVLVILGCLAVAQCAPTEQVAPPLKEGTQQDIHAKAAPPLREFLILTPEAQLQLQPALKQQQPMIQPITLYGSSGSQRQYDAICSQIQTGIGGIYEIFMNNLPQFGDQGDGSGSKDSITSQQLAIANAEGQTLPLAILPKISGAEHPVAVQHRFYTITGQPQFFTNEAIVQPSLQPLFSIPPLQAIKARSVAEPLNAVLQEGHSPNLISQNSDGLPLASDEEQKRHEEEEKKIHEEALHALVQNWNAELGYPESKAAKSVDIIEPKELVVAESANSENAARSFASDEENKRQEEEEKKKHEEALHALVQDWNAELGYPESKAAKSVDIIEPKELVVAESANNAELQPEQQSANLEQQQVLLVPEENANAAVEN